MEYPQAVRLALKCSCVKEKIINIDREDAAFIVLGGNDISRNDDLLERIVDFCKRSRFLGSLLLVGDRICRLNIISARAEIADEVDFELLANDLARILYGNRNNTDINMISTHKGKHFYFVAINDVNEFGKPIGQSNDNINIALTAVADAIKRMGHYDTLCIPLLGSGRAAIQEATKENVFQRTVDYFIQSDEKLASKLIISVKPEDYLDKKIDLERIGKYLDYRCEFGKMEPERSCKLAQ